MLSRLVSTVPEHNSASSGGTSSFLSAMGWTTGLRVAGLPLQFGVFVLVARLYDLRSVGTYAVANSIWQVFKGLGPLGLDLAALRFGAALRSQGDWGALRAIEAKSQRTVGVVNSCLAGLMAIAGLSWLSRGDASPSVIAIVSMGVPIYALLGLQVAQLRARELVRLAQFPESILLNVFTGLAILLASRLAPGAIVWALLGTLASAFTIVVVYAVRFRGLHRTASVADTADWRGVASTAAHMFVGQALVTVSARSGPIVIGAVSGAASAGLFEGATRLGQLASVSTWAAGVAAAPQFAAAHARGAKERLQALVVAASWSAFLPAAMVTAMIGVAGRSLLAVFGPQFVPAYSAAMLVSIATTVNAAGGLSSTALYMAAKERVAVQLTAASLVVLVACMLVLLPHLGLAGAGAAYVAASIVRDVGASIAIVVALGIHPGVFAIAGWREFFAAVRRRI